MRVDVVGAVVSAAVWLIPAGAAAQERGQVGATMGYPAQFGVIWHASDDVAIRPEFSFIHTSVESTTSILSTPSSSNDTSAVAGGASVLWYFQKRDNVRTYVAPRVAFSHSSFESGLSTALVPNTNSYAITATLGAQYTPVKKFGVFGEIGYGFTHGSVKVTTPIYTAKTTTGAWSPRGAVGVIYYFGG